MNRRITKVSSDREAKTRYNKLRTLKKKYEELRKELMVMKRGTRGFRRVKAKQRALKVEIENVNKAYQRMAQQRSEQLC